VKVDRRGLATALVGGLLAIGRKSGVRDAIDAHSAAKGTASLADDPAAGAARNALPHKRLADAYLSEDGIGRLIANPRGTLGPLSSLIEPRASRGVAAALVAGDEGLDLDLRSELDPDRARARPGFFSAFPPFEPTLASSLSADSLGYVGIADPAKALGSLLKQARAEEPGLATAVRPLVKRVKELGNVDLQQDLLPSLGGQAALALEPSPGGGGGGPGKNRGANARGRSRNAPLAPPPSTGTIPNSETPFVVFLGSGIDAARARRALARLQAPIAHALEPSKQAPAFSERKLGEVTARSLRLSPTVNLTYAIVESMLVVATDPAAVDQIAAGEHRLDQADLFEAATEDMPGHVSVLGYLNLEGLIALAEHAGLSEDPAYATFAPEIRRLHALGLTVKSSDRELSTDLRLVIGEGPGRAARGDVAAGVPPE